MPRPTTPARTVYAMALVGLAIVASACTVSTGGGGTAGPLSIRSFVATRTSAPAPLTTALAWNITGMAPLTCDLDLDDDGDPEITVNDCSNSSIRSATFDTPGTHVARLSVTDETGTVTSPPVQLTVGLPSTDAFEITLRYAQPLSGPQRAAFEAAAARWSQVVRTGLPDATLDIPADDCLTGTAAFSGPVDDVLVDASIAPIDGPGGILAEAGPCERRPGGGLPHYGVIKFDSADVPGLQSAGQLEDVVLHEMAHVLGFGTLWGALLSGAGTTNPRFVGLIARGAWDATPGGSGVSVPVENSGGPGTRDSHWRESVFGNELMTGYIGSGANPLSAVTVGSLADLGYGVDLGAADPFGLPGLRSLQTPATELRTRLVLPDDDR